MTLVLACAAEELSGSAADELQYYIACGATVLEVTDADDNLRFAEIENLALRADLLIDALLGTGFSGKMRSLFLRLCGCINRAKERILPAAFWQWIFPPVLMRIRERLTAVQ